MDFVVMATWVRGADEKLIECKRTFNCVAQAIYTRIIYII